MSTSNNIMQSILAEMAQERATAAKEADSMREELRNQLLAAGAIRAHAAFSGGGDSGSIDDFWIEFPAGHTVSDETKDKLKKTFEKFVYKWLESTGVDWYNNDGGQGEVTIDLSSFPVSIEANVDVNETVSSTAHEESGVF